MICASLVTKIDQANDRQKNLSFFSFTRTNYLYTIHCTYIDFFSVNKMTFESTEQSVYSCQLIKLRINLDFFNSGCINKKY